MATSPNRPSINFLLKPYNFHRHPPDRTTGEEHNPLQFLVIKEVVEGPEASLFTKRIRVQIWVVAENNRRHKKNNSI